MFASPCTVWSRGCRTKEGNRPGRGSAGESFISNRAGLTGRPLSSWHTSEPVEIIRAISALPMVFSLSQVSALGQTKVVFSCISLLPKWALRLRGGFVPWSLLGSPGLTGCNLSKPCLQNWAGECQSKVLSQASMGKQRRGAESPGMGKAHPREYQQRGVLNFCCSKEMAV